MPLFNLDTIAAFATAPSSGAVALLRISGVDCLAILQELTGKKSFTPRYATLVKIYDGSAVLDNALAIYFKGPQSYTGEDVLEFTLHASPYIKKRILEILINLGARPAKPGEFTMRAFLNGKMDLAEAQGVADIIAAKNKAAHKAAINSLDGKLSAKFNAIKSGLINLLAQVEVRIDDADEEMPALDNNLIKNQLAGISQTVIAVADTFRAGRMVKDGIQIAIIGVPNSGKSSLLNRLLGYDRAIVSPISGTTRDTVEANLEIEGFSLLLIDTAGIRAHSVDEAEVEGMRRTQAAAQEADLIIFLQDANAQDAVRQTALYAEVCALGKKVLTVVNKADLLTNTQQLGQLLISCKTGTGIDNLKHEIVKAIGLAALQEDDIIITSATQYQALTAAAAELDCAALHTADLELFAEHLRGALLQLQQLIGEVTTDDILDIIFAKFCVGK